MTNGRFDVIIIGTGAGGGTLARRLALSDLSKLPRAEKKLRVALDWTLDLLFSKDLVQFATLPSSAAPPRLPSPARPHVETVR